MKKVLYNDCYGGFAISEEGIDLLINEFPEKASKYGWKKQKKNI